MRGLEGDLAGVRADIADLRRADASLLGRLTGGEGPKVRDAKKAAPIATIKSGQSVPPAEE